MIFETIKFLSGEVNVYLSQKMGTFPEPRVRLGNVSRAFDETLTGANSLNDKAIISVVNVEEDRVAKMQENYIKTDATTVYKSPPVYLNLYVLFAVNRLDYKESLQWLGHIIQYFQHQNVFTPDSHPALGETPIQKLIIDLHTLNFEQSNQMWSTLGGKYIPSVLYKIRQVTIDENLKQSESGFIKEIEIKDKMKLPVS